MKFLNDTGLSHFMSTIKGAMGVIDVTNGVTAAIKATLQAEPWHMLKYNEYYYMPQYNGNSGSVALPNYYNCFEGDGNDFHWLYINWEDLEIEHHEKNYLGQDEDISVSQLPNSGVTAGTYKRVTVDAKGRVTAGDNVDSDANVTQEPTGGNANYEVIFSGSADNSQKTEHVRKHSNFLFNPSTGNLQVTQLNGVTIGSSPKFTDTNTWRPIGTGATDAAAGNHTHGINIATDSGTNQITLAASTKYKLTAGGQSYVFTTPPNSTYNFSGTSFTSNNSTGQDANNVTYNAVTYYTSNGPNTTLGASATDGALYSQAYSTSWVGQIAQDYRNGNLYTRGKNNGTWQSWRKVRYTDDTIPYSQVTGTPSSLPASDVYAWAKASTKPSYSYSEISGRPTHAANIALTTSANYITEPEFKSVKINGSSSNAASSSNCLMQFDTTNKCLKFVFN